MGTHSLARVSLKRFVHVGCTRRLAGRLRGSLRNSRSPLPVEYGESTSICLILLQPKNTILNFC